MKKLCFMLFVIVLVLLSSTALADSQITVKGRLIDEVTNNPVDGARLLSAYKFTPSEVVTDSNGNFEFTITSDFIRKEGAEAGLPDIGGSYYFEAPCYFFSSIVFQKNYGIWESGQMKSKYLLALRKIEFDKDEIVTDVSGKTIVDAGNLKLYPAAHISTQSDIEASFEVQYKLKNSPGYNGGGSGGFIYNHALSSALPLNYDVFIKFKEENGKQQLSSTYHVPVDAHCRTINLDYSKGKSTWGIIGIKDDYAQTPIKFFELELDKGWNLVPYFRVTNIMEDSEIKTRGLVAQYWYIRGVNKYFKLHPQDDEKLDKELKKAGIDGNWINSNLKYLLNSGTWLYSNKKGTLKVTNRGDFEQVVHHKYVGLNAGWNLKTISRSMIDKTIEDVKGSCDIIKIAEWGATNQRWNAQTYEEIKNVKFENTALNNVAAFKVASDCMFADATDEGLEPPAIPT